MAKTNCRIACRCRRPSTLLLCVSAMTIVLQLGVVLIVSTSIGPVQAAEWYSVTYKARFKWELATTCEGPKAPLYLECPMENAVLTVLDSNHENIKWFPREDYGNSVRFGDDVCTTYETCSEVFVTDDHLDDVFGELFFICSGYSKTDTQALVTYQAGQDSSCTPEIWGGTGGFHYVQLGIMCNHDFNSGAFIDYGDDLFVYPNQMLECTDQGTSENINGRYTCANGVNCGGGFCTVTYQNNTIESDPSFFTETCFDQQDIAGTAPPTETKPVEKIPPGNYTARYQALWTADSSPGNFAWFCDIPLPTIELSCMDGAVLSNLEPLYDQLICEQVDPSTALCRETCADCNHYYTRSSTEYRFSGITYQCEGVDRPPMSRALYLEENYSTSGCYSSSSFYEVFQVLELGVWCGSVFSGDYVFRDEFVECNAGAQFGRNRDNSHFHCQRGPEGPLVNNVFTVPTVGVYTTSVGEDCFLLDAVPTPMPTLSPTTASPTVGPTISREPTVVATTTDPLTAVPTSQSTPEASTSPTVGPTTAADQTTAVPTSQSTPTVTRDDTSSTSPTVGPTTTMDQPTAVPTSQSTTEATRGDSLSSSAVILVRNKSLLHSVIVWSSIMLWGFVET